MVYIDLFSIIVAFALAIITRFRILTNVLGSNLVIGTYLLFLVALGAYVILMLIRPVIRNDSLSRRDIAGLRADQQISLTFVYILVFG